LLVLHLGHRRAGIHAADVKLSGTKLKYLSPLNADAGTVAVQVAWNMFV